ncbi:MAG TPA: DUF308 domain-containing protein [Gemmatimonadaceae bacterium]
MQSGIDRRLWMRIADSLFWRGCVIAAAGAVAVRWPADGLLLGMMAVGTLTIVFGLVDITVSLSRVPRSGWRWALLLHGVLSVLFGAISVGSLGLSTESMSILFAIWLGVVGVVALAASIVAARSRTVAIIGLTIFVASVLANILVLADTRLSELTLLYSGAAYAALLGIGEIGLGRWLRSGAAVLGGPDAVRTA